MQTVTDILEFCRSQIGVAEDPMGSNNVIYNTDYYGKPVSGDKYPWCCVFVWDVFRWRTVAPATFSIVAFV